MTKCKCVYIIYTTSQKFLNILMFFIEVSSAQAFIYLIQSTAKQSNNTSKITVFYSNIFLNVIYSCDFKADFFSIIARSSHMILQKSF